MIALTAILGFGFRPSNLFVASQASCPAHFSLKEVPMEIFIISKTFVAWSGQARRPTLQEGRYNPSSRYLALLQNEGVVHCYRREIRG